MAPPIIKKMMNRGSMGCALLSFTTAILFANLANAAEPAPRTRSFSFEYAAAVKGIPDDAKRVELWIPVPQDDAYQKIANWNIESKYAHTITASPDGNKMVHVVVENPGESIVAVMMNFNAIRQEHKQPLVKGAPAAASEQDQQALAQWLRPDRLVPLDEKIRGWAKEVVEAAHAHTDVEMARAIYNHVVQTVKYDKTGKGWGRGDIYYACEARRGNCTDFHAIFIGYARSLGIPARFAIGFPLPAEHGEGKIAGYHCWAEFYAKGIGWVPVDASEAAKDPSKREYFFGTHDENRIEFSKGRDIVLAPKQQGEPLNFFVYPYAEVDGKPFAGTAYEAAYRDAPTPLTEPKTIQ